LAFLVAKNLEDGDWQALTLWSTVFFVIPVVLNYLYLDESVRYALVMGKLDLAFSIIAKMVKFNTKNPDADITPEQK